MLDPHPQLLQTGDGLCGVAGEQVVEQAEAGEGVVDPVEDPRLQLLDHISLQVQRRDRPKVAQLPAAKVPELFDETLVQESHLNEETNLIEFCARSRKASPARLFKARGTLASWQPCTLSVREREREGKQGESEGEHDGDLEVQILEALLEAIEGPLKIK